MCLQVFHCRYRQLKVIIRNFEIMESSTMMTKELTQKAHLIFTATSLKVTQKSVCYLHRLRRVASLGEWLSQNIWRSIVWVITNHMVATGLQLIQKLIQKLVNTFSAWLWSIIIIILTRWSAISIFWIATLKLNGVSATSTSVHINLSASCGVVYFFCKVRVTRLLHAPPERKAHDHYHTQFSID